MVSSYPIIKYAYFGYTPQVFTGNSDKNTIVYNDLPSPGGKPIEARYIRVRPVEFYGNICMRVEFYECAGKLKNIVFTVAFS